MFNWTAITRHMAVGVFGVLLVVPLTADTLKLKTGRMIEGRVTGETSDAVTFESTEGRFTFPRQRISQISKAPASQNTLNDVGDLLAAGQLDAALNLYDRADLASEFAPGTFEALLLEKMKHSAGTAVCTSATAAALAATFQSTINPPQELLLFSSALATELENYDAAHALLRRITLPPPRQSVWPATTLSRLLNRIADAAIRDNRGDLVAAAGTLSPHLLDSRTSNKPDPLRTYAEIEELRSSGDYLKATSQFHPDLFLHRADLFRPLAERLLISILVAPPTRHNLAALESARVTLFPYIPPRLRTRATRALLSRLVADDRLQTARKIADEVSTQNPDEGALATHLVDFHQRSRAISGDSPLEKYKLAAWARKMGLLEEAAPLFQELEKDARFSANAQLQLNLIQNAQCTRELDYLRQLYDNNEFAQLEAEVQKFTKTAPPDAFAQQARDLLQLAKFQMWSNGKVAIGKAEAELQQAERLALRRDYDAALLHLNRIQMEVGNPDANKKARALKDKIMRARSLEQAQQITPP